MEAAFDHAVVEARWRDAWKRSNLFEADARTGKRTFSMTLPPPSITASMHMGHALQGTVQDVCARYRRMCGYEVLWLPGTDHAAIGTQIAIERDLAAEGITKEAVGRDEFGRRAERWYVESATEILDQFGELGMALDFSRTRFSLDEAYQQAVRAAFVELWTRKMIYRELRVGNRCLSCGNNLADIEVRSRNVEVMRYSVECALDTEPGRTISATTDRIESALAWTAIAVPPDDESATAGAYAVVPVLGRRVPIVADGSVRTATLIAPTHDADQLDLARRHGLDVLAPRLPGGSEFSAESCDEIVRGLAASGRLRELGPGAGRERSCGRCAGPVEATASVQWFLRVGELVVRADEAARGGRPRWHPPRFEEVHRRRMREHRDWCISRQLWIGHRIPVFECESGHEFASASAVPGCVECGSTQVRQDPDVLDTWFASALWPFATLGWPEKSPDLAAFYPTDVTVTNREIIGLALTRTVMAGLVLTGEVPFVEVVITCNVLAPDGLKMATSRGNGIDPRTVIRQAGADALRGWMAASATRAQDVRFDPGRVEGYRRFVHRLWRELTGVLETCPAPVEPARHCEDGDVPLTDRWILSRLSGLIDACSDGYERYQFHEALAALEAFATGELYRWYLPEAADRSRAADAGSAATLLEVLSVFLRLLHPVMPFVTEELWRRMPGDRDFLLRAPWPVASDYPVDAVAEARFDGLKDAARQVRAEPASAATRQLRRERAKLTAQLADPEFVRNADPSVVAERRAALAAVEERWSPEVGGCKDA